MEDTYIVKGPNPYIEITRSVSFKKNIGNYQSLDLFVAQKAECKPEDADATSRRLVKWCQNQIAEDFADLQETHPEFFKADTTILKNAA
jgi:hypothetical protein